MTDPLLEVRDLCVTYRGSVSALHGISMRVDEGTVVAVLGGNGAGKSTLLRAISQTLALHGGAVEGGSISFDGRELTSADPAGIVRSGVVQVPEGRRIFGHLTVEENLRAGGLTARGRRRQSAARAQIYELFPILEQRGSQLGALLSGGEQQMLAIGRALMSEPRVLLLDEPSLGLAPHMVDLIGEVIAEINRRGTSVVLVEQNAAMALALANYAYVLEVGRVTLEDGAAALADSAEVRDRYLGVHSEERPMRRPRAVRSSSGARSLRARGVSVRFGGIAALEDVDVTVAAGSIHALIGPNGAGKSTCLNVLTGVYRASTGSVRYGDTELIGLSPHRIARLGVSRTFQNIAVSGAATVEQNLMLGRHRLTRAGFLSGGLGAPAAKRERSRQREHIWEIAAVVELHEKLDHPVRTLAYGDLKRVELARALCAQPTLLLLDEPVAGMASVESERMAETIVTLRDRLDISILLVEHDMAFVMGIADRVTVLDFGQRIADGSPAEVQRDPQVLRAYLGAHNAEVAA